MAGLKPVSFTTEQSAQDAEIARRIALAQQLQQQSMESDPVRMQGHIVTGPSWTQGLARMLNAYQANQMQKKAEEEQLRLGTERDARRSADMSMLAQALQGRQATLGGLNEDAAGNVTQAPGLPAQTPQQSLTQAIPMMGPQMQPVAFQALQQEREREDMQAARREDLKLRLGSEEKRAAEAAAERSARERIAAQQRADMARLTASLRPQPQPHQPQIIQTQQGPMILQPDGTAKPITGPNGAQLQAPARQGGPMTATAQKELIETEEQIQSSQAALDLFKQAAAINNQAMGFTGAGMLASAGSILPSSIRPQAVNATQNLDNMLQSAALPQLKAIFGGMPTEGERKILLDVQGSSSKPPQVREEIFKRAEAAINARLKFSTEKAKRLREGTYFTGEGLPSIQGPKDSGGDRRDAPRAGRTVVVDY